MIRISVRQSGLAPALGLALLALEPAAGQCLVFETDTAIVQRGFAGR